MAVEAQAKATPGEERRAVVAPLETAAAEVAP